MKRMPFKSYDLKNVTMLVIEKHPLMRQLMKEVLAELGVGTVLETSDTTKALLFFQDHTVDIIVSDWCPSLDTLGFIRAVRNQKTSPNPFVPVIVVTAFTEVGHMRQAQDAGMTEFLARPVSARLVYGRICSLIEKDRTFVNAGDFFGPDRRGLSIKPYQGAERRSDKPPKLRMRQI